MIETKADLLEYLEEDKKALGFSGYSRPRLLRDDIWRYQVLLRKAEYHNNAHHRIRGFFYKARHYRYGIKLGFTIPLNTTGKGLNIAHVGTIVISKYARLGEYCRIHAGVNIGVAAGTKTDAPIVGNRVYIGPGAKLFGSISIADDVAIGANAVVNKSVTESGVSVGGVPARIISEKGSEGALYAPSSSHE